MLAQTATPEEVRIDASCLNRRGGPLALKVPPELATAATLNTAIVAAQEAFHADARTTSPKANRWIEAK